MEPDKIDCNGNKDVFITTNGGEAVINYSKYCNIFATNTKLLIKQSKLVKLDVADSAFSLDNGENLRAAGNHLTLHGENFTDCLMHGANNCATVQNSNDVILSGSGSSLILIRSQHPKVYGMGNIIAGKSNENLVVCGHENAVVAEENKDLKVLGHDNQVSATKTQRVSIEGNKHKVFVKDVVVSHRITTTGEETNNETELIINNEMNFIGLPTRCPIFAHIMHQARPPRVMVPLVFPTIVIKKFPNTKESNGSDVDDTKQNSSEISKELGCVCENFFKDYKEQKNSNVPIPVFPQLHIRYMDKAIISNEDYAIGIFHVQVTGLLEIHQTNQLVKVRVVTDELDPGTYKSLMAFSDSKSVTFAGGKNGKTQTLRLTGNHITENADGSFNVSFFEEENEFTAQIEDMDEDASDTEIVGVDKDVVKMEDDSYPEMPGMDDYSSDSD